MIAFTLTKSQEFAKQYLNTTLQPGMRYIIGGHSKGGNLAMYAIANLDPEKRSWIDHLYVLDAPGFAPDVFDYEKLKPLYGMTTRLMPEFAIISKIYEIDFPDTIIVESSGVATQQHDVITWQLYGPRFRLAEKNSAVSKAVMEVVMRWVKNESIEERKLFVNEIFDALRKRYDFILIDDPHKVDAAHDAFCICTFCIKNAAGLKTDRDVECRVPFVAQFLNGNVLADFHAGPELYAHLLHHIDLSVYHVLLQSEGRYAVSQHSAEGLLFFKYSHRIAALTQIVSCRKSARTGSDDGHLVLITPESADLFAAFRDESSLRLEFLSCYKFLDLIDGYRLVDRTAGASVLASSVADRAAYCRQRIVLLDQFKSFPVSALIRHVDVALYREVGRTYCRALAARNALVVIDVGSVGGCRHMRRIEKL